MWHAFPDEYVRAQVMVGALVAFGVARVVVTGIGSSATGALPR